MFERSWGVQYIGRSLLTGGEDIDSLTCHHPVLPGAWGGRTGDGGWWFIWCESVKGIVCHSVDRWNCSWCVVSSCPSVEAWGLFKVAFGGRIARLHDRWRICDAWYGNDR